MRIVYILVIAYLGLLGIGAFFFDYTNFHWFWKLALGLLAVVCVILSISYQHIEKKTEKRERMRSEMNADMQRDAIKSKLDVLKEKEKKGLFTESDYLNRISLELDELNLNIQNQKNIFDRQYLTLYFDEVAKIPEFYTWEEWKKTENLLFHRMFGELRGRFVARGTFHGGARKKMEKEFKEEREAYIKAKEREFNKSTKKQ
ncbi:MAG: hypothetical protein ISS47_06595 [Candidatus Omnitrophica bacterium]|nr:hypothetical protein [Candidatus Omnitrophota bacterium]